MDQCMLWCGEGRTDDRSPLSDISTGAKCTAKNRASGGSAGMRTSDPISVRCLIFYEIPQGFLMEHELFRFLIHRVSFLNSTLFYRFFPSTPCQATAAS